MTLSGISYINDVSDWQSVTARFYESVYNNNNNDQNENDDTSSNNIMIDTAAVEITLTNQNTKSSRRRMLQTSDTTTTTTTSVEVTYTQTTTYHSVDPSDASMNEILQLPLSTEKYREEYVKELQLGLEGYQDLTSVSSISAPSNGDGGDKAIDGTNDAGDGLSNGQIIGIACGGAAFLLLLGAFVAYRRMDKEDNNNKEDEDDKNANKLANMDESFDAANNGRGITTVRSSSPNQRPIGTATSKKRQGPTLGDMSVASGEYYPGGDLSDSNVNVAEELLTIYAPAGKLGIVIDSPDSGAPVIHGLKESSPIADKVRVGDRLVAVDDEDVRAMMAIKVSKLISRKGSSSRKLTVIRYNVVSS